MERHKNRVAESGQEETTEEAALANTVGYAFQILLYFV